VIVAAELLLEQTVHALDLLLLSKLLAIIAGATFSTLAVLAGWIGPTLVATLLAKATITLEVELCVFSTTQATCGTGITSHDSDPSPFGWSATIVGDRGHILDGRDPKSGRLKCP
jgi:hypothetical protein